MLRRCSGSLRTSPLLGSQVLVAKEDDAVFAESVADLGQHRLCRRHGEVDAANLCAEGRRKRFHPDVVVSHFALPFTATSRTLPRTPPAARAGSAVRSANVARATARPDSGARVHPPAAARQRPDGARPVRRPCARTGRSVARYRSLATPPRAPARAPPARRAI